MANENFIDQVVTPEAEAGVVSLKAQLADLNQQFIDTARGAATLLAATGNATSLRALNTESARAAQATERLNGIQLRNQITQERLNQTVARGVQQQQRASQAATQALTPYQQLINKQKELTLAARNAGAEFGQSSVQYTQAAARANDVNRQVSGINRGLGNFSDNVGNYSNSITNSLGKAFSGIRFLANVIPNFGIGTFFLLLGTGIAKAAQEFGLFAEKINQTKENLDAFNDINKNANKEISEQTTNLKYLYAAATDLTNSDVKRKQAVNELQKEFPNYFKNIKDETILNGDAKDVYDDLTKSIYASARARAAVNKIQDLTNKQLDAQVQIEKINNAEFNETLKDEVEFRNRVAGAINYELKQRGKQPATEQQITEAVKKAQAGQTNDVLVNIKKRADAAKKSQQDIISSTQKTIDLISKVAGGDTALGNSIAEGKDNTDKPAKPKGKTPAQILEEQLKAIKLAQSAIFDNDKLTADVRNAALYKFEKDSEDLILKAEKNKVLSVLEASNKSAEVEKIGTDKRAAIVKEYYDAAKLYAEKYIKDSQDLGKAGIEVALKQENENLLNIESTRAQADRDLSERYVNGLITKKDYEAQKLKIERAATQESLSAQIGALEFVIGIEKAFGIDSARDEEKLARLKIALSKSVTDAQVADFDKQKAHQKEVLDTILKYFTQAADLTHQLFDNSIKSRQQALEDQSKQVDDNAENEKKLVENSLDTQQNKARKEAIIDAQTKARKEQIAKEQRKLAREQAEFDKAVSIAKIIAATAVAVVEALPNLVLAAIVAAAGAAELAVVLTTPLPAFAKGVKNFSGGMALVGEEGRERIDTPFGSFLSPDVATAMYLPQGTDVTPHAATMRQIRPENLSGYGKRESVPWGALISATKANKPVAPKQPRRGGYTDVARAIATQDYFRRRGA